MNSPQVEYVDVFFPGQGDTLTLAPAYHWDRTEAPAEVSAKEGLSEQNEPDSNAIHTYGVTANFYTSTRDPNELLIAVISTDRPMRQRMAQAKVTVDFTNLLYHNYDGFGVGMPGLIVTDAGNVVAVCCRRHDSMSDGGHENDLLSARSEDNGKTWSRQQVIHAEPGQYTFLGAIVEDRVTRTILVTFWNIPADVRDDLGYFNTYAAQGGGFGLVRSTDDGRTWSDAVRVDPSPNAEGWTGWPNNNEHGIQLMAGPHRGRLVIPGFLYKEGEPGQVPGRACAAACSTATTTELRRGRSAQSYPEWISTRRRWWKPSMRRRGRTSTSAIAETRSAATAEPMPAAATADGASTNSASIPNSAAGRSTWASPAMARATTTDRRLCCSPIRSASTAASPAVPK